MDEKEKRNKLLMSQGIKLVPQEPTLKPKSRLIDPLSKSGPVAHIIKHEKEEAKTAVQNPKKKRKIPLKKILAVILLISLGIIAVIGLKDKVSTLIFPAGNTPEEIIRQVGRLTTLPKDENPTVMTVKNPEVLSGQVFFAEAKAGDKVLIYSVSKKAILYRPSEKRIILMAVLNQ